MPFCRIEMVFAAHERELLNACFEQFPSLEGLAHELIILLVIELKVPTAPCI